MRRIAVLTSGGDAPGMNACLRAVVRYAIYNNIEVYTVERGYNGLINNNIRICDARTVSDIIQRGGTKIKTARCPEFNTYEGLRKASQNLSNFEIDGLVVLGGDGTFRGADDISKQFNVNVVGIPCTIDNDLNYTDFTIGFDTACNTVLSAINNLRDTMDSHDRVNIIEVMGRKCGDIALYTGLAGGAEIICTPEQELKLDEICARLEANHNRGKTSNIIIVAEGVMPAGELMNKIKEKIDISIRTTVLGHIQRGGTPTMMDRTLAARMAIRAIDVLKEGATRRVVGIKDNDIFDMDIQEALRLPRDFDDKLHKVANILSL